MLACVLHALGTKLAAVRGFRKLRIGSSTAFGVAVYWFRTQPRSEAAGQKKCFMDSKGNGKHFFWLVFLACLSSACSGVNLAFSDPLPTSFIFVSVQVIGCLSATVLYLCFFLRLRSCSFGTVWKGCERIVFGLPELGL